MAKRQKQKFQVEFDGPTPDEAELVTAREFQEYLRDAVKAMILDGQPQDTEALYYADLTSLTVTGI